MSLEDLAPRVKELIGGLIAKPKMSDKLLGKPPFRFLHDVVSAVTAATGFAQGLYDTEMLDSGNITDKSGKIAYLETIFNMVGICRGHPIDVRAQKVVAGLEAGNTAIFLVALAECATDSNIDSDAAVRRARNGEVAGDGPAATKGGGGGGSGGGEAKSESKSSASPARSSGGDRKEADDGAKGFPDDAGPSAMGPPDGFGLDNAEAQERGKSRSGTRGNKPKDSSAGAAGAGLMGTGGGTEPNRPVDLDEHIERCDGTPSTTQALLGPLIVRPKLSDKLLGKPPFRFLHDVVMETVRATGFGQHLYGDTESDSSQVSSKDAKMAFLEKMIKVVGIQLNTIVEARPAKIVAGLEPQNTNVFLQLMAVAAAKMPNSYESVKTVREQEGESMPAREDRAGGHVQQEREVFSPSAEAKRERAPARESPERREIGPGSGSGSSSNSGAAAEEKGADNEAKDGADGETRSMRPTTARRRPPKIKDGARELTAKETAPATKRTTGIMRDGEGDDDDDDDDDVLADQKRLGGGLAAQASPSKGVSDDAEVESKLVKDIRSRQAEQEAAEAPAEVAEEKATVGVEEPQGQGGGIRIGARLRSKKKPTGAGGEGRASSGAGSSGAGGSGGAVMTPADVKRLRNAIQVLVQQTGPLGTCMDYIQEDVGQMSSELHRWEEDCRTHERTLEEEEGRSAEILRPLQLELKDLEKQVDESMAKISAMKAEIAKNERKVTSILKLVATA